MIPVTLADDGGVPPPRPDVATRGVAGARRAAAGSRSCASSCRPGLRGVVARTPPVARPRRRRDAPAPLHGVQQPLLERRVAAADGVAAGHDLHLRRVALRRLAPTGVGRRRSCSSCARARLERARPGDHSSEGAALRRACMTQPARPLAMIRMPDVLTGAPTVTSERADQDGGGTTSPSATARRSRSIASRSRSSSGASRR